MFERLLAIEMKDWTPKVLAITTLLGYLSVQWFLLTHIVDPEMREMVMRSLGTLDALMGYVFGFYYGSSDNKQQLIDQAKQLKKD
jgi:hypothetical protein